MDPAEALLQAISGRNHAEVVSIVETGFNLNQPIDIGAPPLLIAVLLGDLTLVEIMLRHGADPNLLAHEPACYEYAQTPLDLAMACRSLMNWDEFHPIVQLLISHGARDSSGEGEISDLARTEAESRAWQVERAANGN